MVQESFLSNTLKMNIVATYCGIKRAMHLALKIGLKSQQCVFAVACHAKIEPHAAGVHAVDVRREIHGVGCGVVFAYPDVLVFAPLYHRKILRRRRRNGNYQ